MRRLVGWGWSSIKMQGRREGSALACTRQLVQEAVHMVQEVVNMAVGDRLCGL